MLEGNNNIDISTCQYSNGLYFLNIEKNGVNETYKIVILH